MTMRIEDQHHFTVAGSCDPNDADVSLTCTRCADFHVWIPVPEDESSAPTLAHLASLGYALEAHR